MSIEQSSSFQSQPKGRPLVMLAVVLSVWIGGRLMLWETPLLMPDAAMESATQLLASQSQHTHESGPAAHAGDNSTGLEARHGFGESQFDVADRPASTMAPMIWEEPVADQSLDELRTGTSHQLIWLAAMSHLPVPDVVQTQIARQSPRSLAQPKPSVPTDRWSLDAWAFWRDGSDNIQASQGRAPTYGASQAGAVLNYRLAPSNARDPRAYARVYRALIERGESEVAAGLSLRPVSDLPIRAHAELRVTEFESSTELRPAAFFTTELPQVSLPLGFKGETYAQAGYVAGEASTLFADGQVHLMRDLKQFDLGKLSVGGAAWGGAQEGAERVDVGPSVRFDLQVGEVPARLSVDYRERVAGDAEPPSGVAVTLSTRF